MKNHFLICAAVFCGVSMQSATAFSAQTATAVKISKVCENSAFVAGAAFSEAASLGYEPDRGLSDFQIPYAFSVLMPPNYMVRTHSVSADMNLNGRFLVEYRVSMEVASGIVPLAIVKMTVFYNESKGAICSLKSVTTPDESN